MQETIYEQLAAMFAAYVSVAEAGIPASIQVYGKDAADALIRWAAWRRYQLERSLTPYNSSDGRQMHWVSLSLSRPTLGRLSAVYAEEIKP